MSDDTSFGVSIDRIARVITIQGIRYSFDLFDQLGFGPEGRLVRLGKRHDGSLTLHVVNEMPTPKAEVA